MEFNFSNLEFLKELHIPAQFGKNRYDEDYTAVDDLAIQLPADIEIKTGATKVVLILNDSFVAKIGFNGTFDEYYKGNDEYEYRFTPFIHSDYCKIEKEIYEKANKASLAMFFTKVDLLCETKEGYPIYVAERVSSFYDEDYYDSSSRDSREKANSIMEEAHTYINDEWAGVALEKYGEELFKKFLNFIDDEDINDLHSGNIGFRKDGTPCLLDFSGYWE
jgi:hypothetical protein